MFSSCLIKCRSVLVLHGTKFWFVELLGEFLGFRWVFSLILSLCFPCQAAIWICYVRGKFSLALCRVVEAILIGEQILGNAFSVIGNIRELKAAQPQMCLLYRRLAFIVVKRRKKKR